MIVFLLVGDRSYGKPNGALHRSSGIVKVAIIIV